MWNRKFIIQILLCAFYSLLKTVLKHCILRAPW